MVRRSKPSDRPSDLPRVLHGLGLCRDLMIDVQRQVKPAGPCDYGAGMVTAAIDAFTTFLTGQRYYFASQTQFMVPEPVRPEHVFDDPPGHSELSGLASEPGSGATSDRSGPDDLRTGRLDPTGET